MATERVNARLTVSLAEHVEKMTSHSGYYETPSEYIRDLIRRDMEKFELYYARDSILEGYKDASMGKIFKSSGNFKKDIVKFKNKEINGWT